LFLGDLISKPLNNTLLDYLDYIITLFNKERNWFYFSLSKHHPFPVH